MSITMILLLAGVCLAVALFAFSADIDQLHNITSTDLVVIADCELVAEGGVNVQGFAEGDAVTVDGADLATVKMGVDGFFAAGYKRVPRTITFKMLPTSPFLETIRQCMATQDSIPRMLQWNMDITYPGLGMTYHCTNGVLANSKEIPDAKEVLDDVTLQFKFQRIISQAL